MNCQFSVYYSKEVIEDGEGGTYRKHLIGLIQNEHLHTIGLEEASLDHVVDTTRGSHNHLRTILKSLHVVTNACSTNASMALDVHEISDSNNDLLDLLSQLTGRSKDKRLALLDAGVDLLENGNGESGGFTSTGLGLGNHIVTCFTLVNRRSVGLEGKAEGKMDGRKEGLSGRRKGGAEG